MKRLTFKFTGRFDHFYKKRDLMVVQRVGVISDTHIHDLAHGGRLAEALIEGPFAEVEMILHAGDVVVPEFLDLFEGRTVYAVRGNMDPAVAGIPHRRIVPVGDFRIGLIHGWGDAAGLESRVLAEFSQDDIDCLVYGHSHWPVSHHRDGVYLFNPGSPTDKRRAASHTVGVIELGDTIEGRILELDPTGWFPKKGA